MCLWILLFLNIYCFKFSESRYFELRNFKSYYIIFTKNIVRYLRAFDNSEFRSVRIDAVNSLEQFSLKEKGN